MRVKTAFIQQAALINPSHQPRHLIAVIADSVDNRQIPLLGKIQQNRCDFLAPLQYRRMRPSMKPRRPYPRIVFQTANNRNSQQVIQTAAVHTNVDDFAVFQHPIQIDFGIFSTILPKFRSCPIISSQRQGNLHIQMLRHKSAKRDFSVRLGCFKFPHQVGFGNRRAHIRIGDVKVFRQSVSAAVQHLLRKLVQHRQ